MTRRETRQSCFALRDAAVSDMENTQKWIARRSVANWKDNGANGKWDWNACRKYMMACKKSWSSSFYT